MRPRIIPCLLLDHTGLIKTVRFKTPQYVGDPINAIRIFNDKEVDELVFLDIYATRNSRRPNFELIEDLASECFMPFAYGGGISSLDDIRQLNKIGVEKVVISSAALTNSAFLRSAVEQFGSSTIVVCLDVKKSLWGNYNIYIHNGSKKINASLEEVLNTLNKLSIGELIVNSIDRDGMMEGYDLQLLEKVVNNTDMPVVALGGAGKNEHFSEAMNKTGIAALAAGSMFVFHGKHKAVLITYPSGEDIEKLTELNAS